LLSVNDSFSDSHFLNNREGYNLEKKVGNDYVIFADIQTSSLLFLWFKRF